MKFKVLIAALAVAALCFIPAFAGCSTSNYVQTVYESVVYTLYDEEDTPVSKDDYYDDDGEVIMPSDGLYYVATGYSNSVGDAVIYSEIDGIPVTSIASQAFLMCRKITSLTVQEGVTNLGSAAFAYCTALTEVTLPSTIVMDYSAFAMCIALESVIIPEGVESIALQAFYGCDSLSRINADEESDINLPSTLTRIGYYAFYSCSSLEGKIVIPDSVTEIETGVFAACYGITEIELGAKVTSIGYAAFSGCSSVTEIALPDSVTEIGEGAFSYCTSLESITLSASLEVIKASAFEGCSSLASVTVRPYSDGTRKGCWLYTEELDEEAGETVGSTSAADKLADFRYNDNYQTEGYLPPSVLEDAESVADYLTDDCVDYYWYFLQYSAS